MKRGAAALAALALLALLAGVAVWRSSVEAERSESASPEAPTTVGAARLAGAGTGARAAAAVRKLDDAAAPAPILFASVEGVVYRDRKPARARVEVRPLGDATVTTRSLLHPVYGKGQPLASTSSDEQGRFRVAGLSFGHYQVVARADDGAVGWGRAFCTALQPCGRAFPNLTGGPESIDAVARYADGTPFRGFVAPSYVPDPTESRSLPEVETDADGRFRLDGLHAGAHDLVFVVPDRWRASVRVGVPFPAGRVFVVDEGLRDLVARVVADDDGSPVVGAEAIVSGRDEASRSRLSREVSDERGELHFRAAGTNLSLEVSRDGFEGVTANVDATAPIVVRLKRQGKVIGRVVQAGTSIPVSGVPIHGWNWYVRSMASPLAVSDEDGRFEARVGPGKGMLYALGHGWVSPALSEVTDRSQDNTRVEAAPGATVEVLLEVVPTGRVEGTLRDAEGRPVAGALVRLTQPSGWNGFPQEILHGDVSSGLTGAEGGFGLENLVPSFPYEVVAVPASGLPARSEVVSARSGETLRVDLRVSAARALTVRVRERGSGRPVEGADVGTSQSSRHEVAGKTGADGVALLEPLLPEPLWLTVWHPDYLPPFRAGPGAQRTRLPEPDADGATFDVALERAAFVAGRVLEPDGVAPRTGGQIGLFPVGAPRGNSFGLTGLARVKPDGTFRLGPVPPGEYDAILLEGGESWTSWRQASRWTVTAGREDLALRVDPAQTERDEDSVALRVLTADGKPVWGFVRIVARARVLENMLPLTDGTCICRAVPPGTSAWVEVRGPHVGETPLPGVLRGPMRLERGPNELRLTDPRTVEGRVVGPDGAPVAGLLVQVAPAPPPEAPAADSTFALPSARTDAKGAFSLPAGDEPVLLVVSVPPGLALAAPPPAVATGSAGVVVRLEAGHSAEVVVTDADGRPVGGAVVDASWPEWGGFSRRVTSDARGVARLAGLSGTAAYRLSVTPPAERADLAAALDATWRPGPVRVALARGEPMRGTVRAAKAVVPYAAIWWRAADGEAWRRADAGPDGAFSVTVPTGAEVSLVAAQQGTTRPEAAGEPVAARAGASGVVVRVPE